ncbi:cytochrome c-550 PedF [Derxia lacustris]|uniref:cytochrome c-550 PedF n=1 Tax=Derxia lacustris TaxID=764842 RepID=UPI000A16D5BC|nr:cytochrome c-550 PedF [Derxia lacustris]
MRSTRSALRSRALAAALAIAGLSLTTAAFAHGDVVPHAVDTSALPQLGEEWRDNNPFTGNDAAIKIGQSAFGQNCARCHGLDAVSGGIAPDLRKLDRDCMDVPNERKKAACYKEVNQYFLMSIRGGKVRNGAIYMPPFEGILSQEAMWSIKAWLETRRTKDE